MVPFEVDFINLYYICVVLGGVKHHEGQLWALLTVGCIGVGTGMQYPVHTEGMQGGQAHGLEILASLLYNGRKWKWNLY